MSEFENGPTTSEKSTAMQRADVANGERVEAAPGGHSVKVLLAVEDSEGSMRAVKRAHVIFGDTAKYYVINVGPHAMQLVDGDSMSWGVPYPMALPVMGVQSMPFQASSGGTATETSAIDLAEAEARSVTTAAELPADAVALGATGDPVEQIRKVSEEHSIDVIVVGSGSGHWWQHFFDPSVSKHVIRHADRPVLIVP